MYFTQIARHRTIQTNHSVIVGARNIGQESNFCSNKPNIHIVHSNSFSHILTFTIKLLMWCCIMMLCTFFNLNCNFCSGSLLHSHSLFLSSITLNFVLFTVFQYSNASGIQHCLNTHRIEIESEEATCCGAANCMTKTFATKLFRKWQNWIFKFCPLYFSRSLSLSLLPAFSAVDVHTCVLLYRHHEHYISNHLNLYGTNERCQLDVCINPYYITCDSNVK